MSNLKNRLKKVASNESIIKTELYLLLEDEIAKKCKEIGYLGNEDGILELINAGLGKNDVENIARAFYIAIELWAEDTLKNYPETIKN